MILKKIESGRLETILQKKKKDLIRLDLNGKAEISAPNVVENAIKLLFSFWKQGEDHLKMWTETVTLVSYTIFLWYKAAHMWNDPGLL